jgi:NADH-quinone oxidoreductase subunit M
MPWMTAIVLLPLAGALSLFAVPAGNLVQARIHALLAAAGTAALVVGALVVFDRGEGGLQLVDDLGWAERAGLSWSLGVDGLSIWLVALTAGIFLLAVAAACRRLPERGTAYLGLILAAETGLLGLFAAGDLVLFYVFWEAMLIPFYFLMGIWGGPDRRAATLKFVIYTMVGSLLMLVAILSTAFVAQDITGQFTFVIRDLVGVSFSHTESVWLFAGFALAFAIKLPLFPFHGWLPGAYRAAPVLVTVLLAAVMSKAGVYGFLRIGLPVFPEGADTLAIPIGVLAVIGIVYGSLLAWRAPTMRLLVAYSSLAHLGFIALGIVAFDLQASQGAVLQMVNHGIVVAAAFAIVGIINRAAPDDRLDDIGGMAASAPRLAGVFLIVAMASLAIPGSNSFVGEFFILTGVFRQHLWLAVLACIGIIYAAVYMLRLYQSSMNGPVRGGDGRAATTATLERTIAPAQVAADRPADQIKAVVPANPPAIVQPLPGDEPTGEATP